MQGKDLHKAIKDLKVGLLGGSFNPAHEAHLEISLCALGKLGLDQIWWLVSPQNPLKSAKGMASYEERLTHAQHIAQCEPRILISDIESQLGTQYTIDSLHKIKEQHPHTRFIWLMGGDNLDQLPRWHRWQDIVALIPFAVFNRPDYSPDLDQTILMQHYKDDYLPEEHASQLSEHSPPRWTYITSTNNPLSATQIREQRAKA